jgi:small-conductance mechanosensitive channel
VTLRHNLVVPGRPRYAAYWLLAWVVTLAPLVVHAQPTAAPTAAPTATAAPPVPLPEIAKRADELAVYLQEVEQRVDPTDVLREIETQLPTVADRVAALRDHSSRVLPARPSLQLVDELSDQWTGMQTTLAAWDAEITTRATQLDQEMRGIAELQAVWRATRDMAPQAGAPAPVVERINSTLALIQATRKQLDAYRQRLLVLQDRIVQLSAVCRDGLNELKDYRRDAVGRLLVRDGVPVWSQPPWAMPWAAMSATLRSQAATSFAIVRDYLATQLPRIPLQLFLFGALFVTWRRARQRTVRWLAEDNSLANVAAVFEHPASSALLLTLLASPWVYPQAPIQLRTVIRIVCIPLLLRVVDRLVDAPLLPAMYLLGAFFIVDQLRVIVAPLAALEQLLFVLEMVAGVAAALWLARSGRLRRLSAHMSPRTVTLIERGALVLAALFAFAALAGALGFMQLARVVSGAVLGSGYSALLIFAMERIAEGVWASALRSRPLRGLRAVQRHRAFLQARGERALSWLGTILWYAAVLRSAELLAPAIEELRAILTARLAVGTFSTSLGNVLAFIVTVWLSFLVSRLVRFILEEDIYPRLHLARGLPYALSSILHYTILLLGLLAAVAAMGVDLDRFTILAGAFGVGVGFGMQNVVNNFFSGLILLFERPIQVGDVVQLDPNLQGEVRRIGIRSSTVRTAEGAEVIVPNARLISEPVINWTFSDRMRRIDLSISVPYGTDPERVLELMRSVAGANPRIVEEPPPAALFMGFGPTTLDFQLRAWTDRFEDWVVIRSELAIALNRALSAAGILPHPQPAAATPAPVPAQIGDGGSGGS